MLRCFSLLCSCIQSLLLELAQGIRMGGQGSLLSGKGLGLGLLCLS